MTELQAEITTGTPATLTTLLKASTPTRGSACESSTAACTLMPPYFLERLMSSTLIRAAFTWSNPKAALLPVGQRDSVVRLLTPAEDVAVERPAVRLQLLV